MAVPLEVFCCYAREDQEMLEHLKKHLAPLQRSDLITVWSDTNLNAGVEWEKELHQRLESADIILLLISPDFIHSDYCYSIEMKRAMERHKQRSAVVIPILLRATVWDGAPFAKLQALPKDAKPVRVWLDIDEAFKNVVEGIKATIEDLMVRGELSATSSLSLADERFSDIPEAFYERIRRNISKGTGAVIVKVDRSQAGEAYYLLPDKAKILLSGSSNWQSVVPLSNVRPAVVRQHPGGIYAAVFEALDTIDFLIWKGPLESDVRNPARRRGVTVHPDQVEVVVFD